MRMRFIIAWRSQCSQCSVLLRDFLKLEAKTFTPECEATFPPQLFPPLPSVTCWISSFPRKICLPGTWGEGF